MGHLDVKTTLSQNITNDSLNKELSCTMKIIFVCATFVLAYEKYSTEGKNKFDIVGPICETGDFIGKDRLMSIEPDNILVIMDTGAYAMSMSSNYNSRPKLFELMIDKDKIYIIREKESFDDLIKGEKILPES